MNHDLKISSFNDYGKQLKLVYCATHIYEKRESMNEMLIDISQLLLSKV